MPVYEYQCTACYNVDEALRKIADRNNPVFCKTCGAISRLILSPFSVPNQKTAEKDKKNSGNSSTLGGLHIKNCNFKSCKVAVSVPKGTELKMEGNRYKHVQTEVKYHDN